MAPAALRNPTCQMHKVAYQKERHDRIYACIWANSKASESELSMELLKSFYMPIMLSEEIHVSCNSSCNSLINRAVYQMFRVSDITGIQGSGIFFDSVMLNCFAKISVQSL